MMGQRRSIGVVFGLALAITACSTSGSATSAPPTSDAGGSPTPSASALGGLNAPTPEPSIVPSPSASASASSSGGPKPSLGLPDPCALLTADEASTLIGVTVPHVQGGGAGTKGPCVYGDAAHDSVAVAVRVAADPDAASALMTAQKNHLGGTAGMTVVTVDGLGDAAFIARSHSGGIIAYGIYVRSGATYFYVTTLSLTLTPTDDALTTAGRTALGNL